MHYSPRAEQVRSQQQRQRGCKLIPSRHKQGQANALRVRASRFQSSRPMLPLRDTLVFRSPSAPMFQILDSSSLGSSANLSERSNLFVGGSVCRHSVAVEKASQAGGHLVARDPDLPLSACFVKKRVPPYVSTGERVPLTMRDGMVKQPIV